MPDNQTALNLIEAAGGFVAAPSANLSGRPSPTLIHHVIEDMDGRIEMIIDGGEARIGLESTIIDLSGKQPEILRPGHITTEMLAPIIGTIKTAPAIKEPDLETPPRAPGMKYRHYAPKGQMSIIDGEEKAVITYINERIIIDKAENKITGVIATAQTFHQYQADSVKLIGDRHDEENIARNLYRILREFDDEAIDIIYCETFPGQAIMNRLLKAASYNLIKTSA
jgi:L-threonylcarbamoyladenylate synthase